jgi:catechol 2,3-dioxygenase-like lactoylglutathione lyase family enzyme
MGISRVVLFVKDLQTMTAFYREGLQLPVVTDRGGEGWVELDAGGTTLVLHGVPDDVAAGITVTVPPQAREDVPLKLVFDVEDLAVALERLAARGAVMREPNGWGGCDGVDPEGNVFQVAVPPSG